MEYRSREKILYQILKTLAGNKTTLTTHIMYECRLSYAQLKQYTKLLEENNLATKIDTAYAINQEGRKMLDALDKLFSIKLKLPS